jgi:hypothetical protein
VVEGSRDLEKLVLVAMSVYYNRDLEKERKDLEKEKRKDKWQEALITALSLPQGKVQTQGHAFNVDRQAILGGSAPGESYLQDPSPICRGKNIGRHTVMMGPRASYPGSVTTIKAEEPRDKHKVSLINTGASISAIPFSPRPKCSKKITLQGISGQPLERYFTLLGRFPFLSLLFNCPRNPYSSARARPSI